VDVHVRKAPFENPKLGLQTARRLDPGFEKQAALSSVVFQGMRYLGSASGIHYFILNGEDAYVSCMSIEPDRLRTQLPLLSQKYHCNTLFELPNATYAWMTNWGVDLREASTSFASARQKVTSFIY
jgi:hypothetical protein